MLIKRKVFFLLISIIALSLALTGCFDLGEATEDEEEYCETYPEIRVIDGAAETTYYTMEDFYNKKAVNDFESPMSEDDRSEYSYLLIEVNKNLSVGEVAVFFESTVQETLQASFFVLDGSEIPTKVYLGEGGRYSESESNEPAENKVLGRASAKIPGVPDQWEAIYLKSWGIGEETSKRIEIKEGQYLVIRLDNNRYDPALKELEAAQKVLLAAQELYAEKLADWQSISNDPGATQEQRNAAMRALTNASEDAAIAERDYETAQSKYEREKFPYQKMPVRITAILINAK